MGAYSLQNVSDASALRRYVATESVYSYASSREPNEMESTSTKRKLCSKSRKNERNVSYDPLTLKLRPTDLKRVVDGPSAREDVSAALSSVCVKLIPPSAMPYCAAILLMSIISRHNTAWSGSSFSKRSLSFAGMRAYCSKSPVRV